MNNVTARNFSRSSATYAAAAEFQRFAAGKLYEFIGNHIPVRQSVGQVLELGCGTGFLTIGLLQLFPGARFVISDISEEMLERCKHNTREVMDLRLSSYFERYDIGEANIEKNYDLIISALAFQWVNNLDVVMANIREHLRSGGRLVFSTLLDGTYSTLHQAFNDVGVAFPGPSLMTEDGIRRSCAVFPNVSINTIDFTETYPSAKKFLKRIQLTGTGNPCGVPVPVGALRRVMQRCSELSSDTFTADYRIANVCCW